MNRGFHSRATYSLGRTVLCDLVTLSHYKSINIKIMQKIILQLILCCLLSSYALASPGTISGNILDLNDNLPIEFATVSIYRASDSTLVTGSVCNEKGTFVVDNLPYDDYYLKVDFIGYNSERVNGIHLNQKKIIIPTVQLTESSLILSEFRVAEEKSTLETRIDKKVFNADKSLVSKGGTGLDMLRDVPSVEVDESDNIKLRGDVNVTVLIDGRPSPIPVSQLLKQIPASTIDRVEIITNPSAKYDSEGMAGILNIILKKNKLKGFNGNLSTSFAQGTTLGNNSSLGLNYRVKKINIHANISSGIGRFDYWGLRDRNVILNDTFSSRLYAEDKAQRKTRAYSVKSGVDYFINDNNMVYVTGSYSANKTYGSEFFDYSNFDQWGNITSTSHRTNEKKSPSLTYGINGGWQKSFKKKGVSLDLDIDYGTNKLKATDKAETHYYDPSSTELGLPSYQNINQNNDRSILLSKLDFTLPINDSVNLELGTHYTSRNFGSEFSSESVIGNGAFQPDTALNNNFNYLQDVVALYMTYGKRFNKIGIKLGLRGEQTFTTSELISTPETYSNNYFQLFPSAHFSFKKDASTEFMLSYSKRINRPKMQLLNPFPSYIDPFTLQAGNPYLKPEIIHVNEVGVVKYWKKVMLNSNLYYRYLNNKNQKFASNEEGVSKLSYRNLGSSSLTGLELILSYSPTKKIKIMSTTNLFKSKVKGELITGNEDVSAFGWTERISLNIRVKKDWRIQVAADYRPEFDVQQGVIGSMYGVGAAIQKSLFKNKGSISLRFSDIFNTREYKFQSHDFDGYSFLSERNWESQTVALSFSYSFGKRSKGKRRRAVKNNSNNDSKKVPGM